MIQKASKNICPLQFLKRDQEDHDAAWQDYLKICKVG
jgi:hypothetical protein